MDTVSHQSIAAAEASSVSEAALSPPRPQNSRREIVAVVLLAVAAHAAMVMGLSQWRGRAPAEFRRVLTVELLQLSSPATPAAAVERKAPPTKSVARSTRPVRVAPVREAPSPMAAPAEEPRAAASEGEALGDANHGAEVPAPKVAAPANPPPTPVVARAEPHEGAHYLSNPRPAYPELARRRNWQGEVLLRVHVTPGGRPAEIAIAKSSGRTVLDESALRAVRDWIFVPARIGDEAIDGWVNVPVVFHLQ